MKLKDIKFEREEDLEILKIILRCLKEENNLYRKRRGKMSLKEIIESCYKFSRHTHIGEPFEVNVYYWPADVLLFSKDTTNLLYISLIINKDWYNVKNVKDRFICLFESFFKNPAKPFSIDFLPYNKTLISALIKAGISNELAEKKVMQLNKLQDAQKESIPF